MVQILEINDEPGMQNSVRIIRESFGTVARDLNLNERNAPTHPSFFTMEQMLFLKNKGVRFYGLFEDDLQCGFIAVEKASDELFYIEKVAVLPEKRHSGYGKMLLDFAVDQIKKAGGREISITVVYESPVIMNWYKKYGFVEKNVKKYDHLPFSVCFMKMEVGIEVEFVEMQEKYLSEVLAIYNYYIQNTIVTFHSHPLTADGMREIVFFDKPCYKTYLMLSGNEVCGYVLLTQHKKREAYDLTAEVTVYLKPGFSGKGLGSVAIQHIEKFARGKEMHVLIATITGSNTASIKLFEKNGYFKCAHYREVGRKFGEILDVVAYQKILS